METQSLALAGLLCQTRSFHSRSPRQHRFKPRPACEAAFDLKGSQICEERNCLLPSMGPSLLSCTMRALEQALQRSLLNLGLSPCRSWPGRHRFWQDRAQCCPSVRQVPSPFCQEKHCGYQKTDRAWWVWWGPFKGNVGAVSGCYDWGWGGVALLRTFLREKDRIAKWPPALARFEDGPMAEAPAL